MRISKAYWIWGQFSFEDERYLNLLKKKVQKILNSPNFEVHITLSGPYQKINDYFLDDLKNLAKSNFPQKIYLNNFNFKKDIYESFYISINNSKGLKNLRKKLYSLNNFNSKEEFQPHISLAYGDHDMDKKISLISELPSLKNSIKISRISLVKVNENLKLWEVIESFKL